MKLGDVRSSDWDGGSVKAEAKMEGSRRVANEYRGTIVRELSWDFFAGGGVKIKQIWKVAEAHDRYLWERKNAGNSVAHVTIFKTSQHSKVCVDAFSVYFR